MNKKSDIKSLAPLGSTPAYETAKAAGVSPLHLEEIRLTGITALDRFLPVPDGIKRIYESLENDVKSKDGCIYIIATSYDGIKDLTPEIDREISGNDSLGIFNF